MINVKTERRITRRGITLIAGMAALGALSAAITVAPSASAADYTVTVDGVDYPVCAVEDCSDQPGQIGVWDSGDNGLWLSLGEYSVPVISGGLK